MPDKNKKYEGFTDKVFMEKGGRKAVPTVGSGINVSEKHNQKILPKDVIEGKRAITGAEDKKATEENMKIAKSDAMAYAGEAWNSLDSRAQDVLIDMHYNMGGPRMSKFKGLQKALQSGDYRRASDEIRYRNADNKEEETPYYKQTGGRAKDHIKTLMSIADEKELSEMMKQGINL